MSISTCQQATNAVSIYHRVNGREIHHHTFMRNLSACESYIGRTRAENGIRIFSLNTVIEVIYKTVYAKNQELLV